MGEHHTAGTLVWVNDAQAGWIKGEVLKMEDKKLKVRTEKGAIGLYKPEDCPLQNPMSRMGVEVSFDQRSDASKKCTLPVEDIACWSCVIYSGNLSGKVVSPALFPWNLYSWYHLSGARIIDT